MMFRKYTNIEVNKALSEAYYQYAGGLHALGHPAAKYMAYSARFYELNFASFGQFFNWLANKKIYKDTWQDLSVMLKFERLDIQTGRSLVRF